MMRLDEPQIFSLVGHVGFEVVAFCTCQFGREGNGAHQLAGFVAMGDLGMLMELRVETDKRLSVSHACTTGKDLYDL